MSTRARWHLADLGLSDDVDPMAHLLNMAKPIDLSLDRAQLQRRLEALMRMEANVWEKTGVDCDLKFERGHSCFACPHYVGDPAAGPMFTVCRISREQEQIEGQLHQHREIEELEKVALDHLLREECDELAEAMLPDEESVPA